MVNSAGGHIYSLFTRNCIDQGSCQAGRLDITMCGNGFQGKVRSVNDSMAANPDREG